MSDFDADAERERLREKYEQDREKREATEQMSELLLQGATMTNAHCSECGDPIFRYEGQEFCATCEHAVDRNGSGDTSDEPAESDDLNRSAGGETVEVTEPTDDRRVVFGGDDGQTAPPESEQSVQRETEPPAEQPTSDVPARTGETAGTSDGDVGTARASLIRTLVRFSERAENTDDPRQAREHLEAARKAAATLAELRR